MPRWSFLLLPFLFILNGFAQKPLVYGIAGQGSDCRIFDSLKLNAHVDFRCLAYVMPPKNSSMTSYAKLLATQIDTTQNFCLIGVSLGGMLACEMAQYIKPDTIVIISSAKSSLDLPKRYLLFRKFPIYKILPGAFYKFSAYILQPTVEYDRNTQRRLFLDMLHAKPAKFLKRSIPMIIEWDTEKPPPNCVQIHGGRDRTLPIKRINPDYIIPGGSHMMCATQAEIIRSLLLNILQ